MKMTKIAFWRKVVDVCGKSKKKETGVCYAYVSGACTCKDDSPAKVNGRCDMAMDMYICKGRKKDVIAYANSQIKIYESKTKKPAVKTDVRDMKDKTAENAKCNRCAKFTTCKRKEKDLSIFLTCDGYAEKMPDPTPLEIAKAIRDNGYVCVRLTPTLYCHNCVLKNPNCSINRKQQIDTYISDHSVDPNKKVEPVMPEPIKFSDNVPVYVYMVTEKAIKKEKAIAFLQRKTESGIVERIVFDYGGEHSFENCYKTFADAVRVAEKKWSVK